MRRLFSLSAVAALATVGVLALPAVNAAASAGPPINSAGQTGKALTGGNFRFVSANVFLRDGGQYASELLGVGGSVSLWTNTGDLILLGISTGTGAAHEPWSPGVGVYHNHVLIAHQGDAAVNDETCTPAHVCTPGDSGLWNDGQLANLQIFYDRLTGVVRFRVTARDGNSYDGHYALGVGKFFVRAQVSADFGFTPFDSAGYVNAPAAVKPLPTWSNSAITTYSGRHATFTAPSWLVHHSVRLTGAAGNANPGSLRNGGRNFTPALAP